MIHKNEFVLEPVFWKNLDRDTIESMMGAEVASMVGFDQRNPYHCYDLFTHTLITMEDCGNRISKTAAFFHDIGKPHVATEKDGRLVFYNHSLYSAIFAKDIMEKMGFEEFEIDHIVFLIRHHDDFINLNDTEEAVNKYLRRIINKNKDFFNEHSIDWVMHNLLSLCIADAKAQAETVTIKGEVINYRKEKINKLLRLRNLIMKALQKGMDN